MNFLFIIVFLTSAIYSFANENVSNKARAVIEAQNRTILSSEIGGNIDYIGKKSGDSFKKGEILVKIHCDVYKAQKNKIRVKKDLANIKLQKNKKLSEYNSVGDFEVEISKLELQEQVLEEKIASINVKRCTIKAPYDGKVVQKFINVHQNVKPQDNLVEIISSAQLEIKSVVPATWLNWLKPNDNAVMKLDEIDLTIPVKIVQLDSIVDPNSQTIQIRVSMKPHENIIAGMSGTLYFNTDKNTSKE